MDSQWSDDDSNQSASFDDNETELGQETNFGSPLHSTNQRDGSLLVEKNSLDNYFCATTNPLILLHQYQIICSENLKKIQENQRLINENEQQINRKKPHYTPNAAIRDSDDLNGTVRQNIFLNFGTEIGVEKESGLEMQTSRILENFRQLGQPNLDSVTFAICEKNTYQDPQISCTSKNCLLFGDLYDSSDERKPSSQLHASDSIFQGDSAYNPKIEVDTSDVLSVSDIMISHEHLPCDRNERDQAAASSTPWNSLVQTISTPSSEEHNNDPVLPNKPRKPRAKKPKDMPRRPLSAYNLFFKDERTKILETIKKEVQVKYSSDLNPNSDGITLRGKVGFERLAQIISKRWKEIPLEEQQVYQAQAAKEMARYREEMSNYNQKKNNQVKPSTNTFKVEGGESEHNIQY